jgi:hypothetical protein
MKSDIENHRKNKYEYKSKIPGVSYPIASRRIAGIKENFLKNEIPGASPL